MDQIIDFFGIRIPISVFILIVPLIGGFITWLLNERSKRKYEEYKRKEERYSELIINLRGFYVSSYNSKLIDKFLLQLDLCWMYCPDEVIRKAYNFLKTVHTDKKSSDEEEKDKALREFILSIRKDLYNRRSKRKTNLKAEDFKIFKSTDESY